MTPFAPRFYRAVRSYAGRLKSRHDEFRMTHFMYSLPEDIRKDIGWPQYEDRPYRRQR
jgi:hypothetical protein